MRQAPQKVRVPRLGFTLVELLVVMTIILVLIGLSLAGVEQVRRKARELKVRNDISQLSSSVAAFKTRYQVANLPSRIMLRNDGNYNFNQNNPYRQLEIDSAAFVKRVWPRLQYPVFNQASRGWFPDDPNASATSAYVLEGWQSLVFFLGGMQHNGSCLGFATNVSNPTVLTGQKDPLLFDFPTDRLISGTNVYGTTALGFQDPFGVFYAYFSSVNGNDYNIQPDPVIPNVAGDCPTLYKATAGGFLPYIELLDTSVNPPIVKFVNRDSFQIISAGKDQGFGPGANNWSAANGYNANSPGADDFSNFHPMALGNGTKGP